ncbi:MAG: hypothetical protein EBZ77_06495, partial [Chitinophagia bacterium]|nr:hypothetical protein [Chitinophagia bacterium]
MNTRSRFPPITYRSGRGGWRLMAVITLLLLAFALAVYVCASYQQLLAWFYPPTDCFYLHDQFSTQYFSPGVKQEGNTYAIAGILLCILAIGYLLYQIKQGKQDSNDGLAIGSVIKKAGWYPIPLLLLGAWVWYQGITRLSPSGDEIFSAINCSEAPLFRTLSYYMLPNNHIFFNLLVHLVSRLGLQHTTLLVGRVISGISFLLMLYCCFVWLSGLLRNRLLALAASVPNVLQYTSLIFALQNRGYALQLLLGWLSFIVVQRYFSKPSQPLLRAYVVITVLGFATVPSYLYFFSAQLVLFACLLLYERRFDGALLRALVFIGIGVYLFYLPALCFSGKHALTSNEYVQSHSGDYVDFMPWFYITLKMFVESIFSFFIQPDHIINMWLFLTPLLLLFSRRKRDRLIVIFYI